MESHGAPAEYPEASSHTARWKAREEVVLVTQGEAPARLLTRAAVATGPKTRQSPMATDTRPTVL